MTPIHLTPEAADKRAIELVEPVAHLLDGLQRMELEMHIARALQLESIDTAKRVAAYLRPLDPMLGSSGRMRLRSRRRSSGSGPEDDDQQEGQRRPAVGGVVGPVAMVETRCGYAGRVNFNSAITRADYGRPCSWARHHALQTGFGFSTEGRDRTARKRWL